MGFGCGVGLGRWRRGAGRVTGWGSRWARRRGRRSWPTRSPRPARSTPARARTAPTSSRPRRSRRAAGRRPRARRRSWSGGGAPHEATCPGRTGRARRLRPVAGRIRTEDVALVREQARIDEVVGEYVALRASGGSSLTGLCPFHDEKSPSFSVTPEPGPVLLLRLPGGRRRHHASWRRSTTSRSPRRSSGWPGGTACSCGTRRAAPASAGSARPRPGTSRPTGRPRSSTPSSSRPPPRPRPVAPSCASAASTRRRPSGSASGTRPKGWDALTRHLRGRGFGDAELLAGGLLSQRAGGGAYDRFRGRLVWPIHSPAGDVIGFGARRLYDDDTGPKYLNTPETPVYRKSEVLFGLDLARRDIGRLQQAVVVEGYTDVMACHLSGVGHRGRHLRDVVRRGPRARAAPAADGPQRAARRGRLHLRRRRGRPEGRGAGVHRGPATS